MLLMGNVCAATGWLFFLSYSEQTFPTSCVLFEEDLSSAQIHGYYTTK